MKHINKSKFDLVIDMHNDKFRANTKNFSTL